MRFILYLAAVLAWVALLWPYPTTVFIAGCVSCVTLPTYRKLQQRLPGVRAVFCYAMLICAMIIVPIAVLVLLVAPQAAAGFKMFQQLRAANFQMPPAWQEYWLQWEEKLSGIPGVSNILHDFSNNVDSMLGQTISTVVSGGFGLLGSTMTALWLLFLFVTLTSLSTVYAPRIRLLLLSLTRMPAPMLTRFIHAIRNALRGVILGILLVALTQGFLCGVAFAVAGIKQPAFWGMLATLVAPIPLVGTALVWVPLCIMLWFTGSTFAAVGLFIWGVVAVGGVDNILRPFFLRQGIKAPLFVLVIAILCGMATFGPVGLIAGPVLVAFAIQAVQESDHLLHPDAHV